MDCIFCKIANGEIPSQKVYEDEDVYAFRDISPVANQHILVIPKQHVESVNELTEKNVHLVSKIFVAIPKICSGLGFANDGYRVVANCGVHGGQTVGHLHFHVIGGQALGWPPFSEV